MTHELVADDWRRWRVLRLAALAESPDAFRSKFADWQGDGDTEARWRARIDDVPFNAVAEIDGHDAGMVSATTPSDDGETELIGLWVSPRARGRGVGDALVDAVVAWAQHARAMRIALKVVAGNRAAINLYGRHGFIDAGAIDCTGSGIAAERRMIRDV